MLLQAALLAYVRRLAVQLHGQGVKAAAVDLSEWRLSAVHCTVTCQWCLAVFNTAVWQTHLGAGLRWAHSSREEYMTQNHSSTALTKSQ